MRTLWNQCNGQGERSQSLWKPSIFRQKMGFSSKRWAVEQRIALQGKSRRCSAPSEGKTTDNWEFRWLRRQMASHEMLHPFDVAVNLLQRVQKCALQAGELFQHSLHFNQFRR